MGPNPATLYTKLWLLQIVYKLDWMCGRRKTSHAARTKTFDVKSIILK